MQRAHLDASREGEVSHLGRRRALDAVAAPQLRHAEAGCLQRGEQRRAVRRVHDDVRRRVRVEARQRTAVHEPALRDDDDLVDALLHLGEQVRAHEHRASLGGEFAQERADPLDALGVEPVDGLVEHEHARIAEQREREPEPLPHSERVSAHAAICVALESHLVQHGGNTVHVDAGGLCIDEQVVSGTAPGVEARRLKRRAHRGERGLQVAVAGAADRRRARGGGDETEQHAQSGRLARAIGAEEARDATGLDGEREIVDGGHGAEALRDAVEDEGDACRHGAPFALEDAIGSAARRARAPSGSAASTRRRARRRRHRASGCGCPRRRARRGEGARAPRRRP